MAGPKTPPISRQKALEVALEIIDEHGLEALSIRRLADEFGVNGASLYYHFENKDAIIAGAAELAMADVRTPAEPAANWREWLLQNARRLREALVEHPGLAAVIVRRSHLGMGAQMLDASARHLMEEGVPIGAVMPLLDALKFFAVGSALHDMRGADRGADDLGTDAYPALAKVVAERGLSSDEIFDVVSSSILVAVDEAVKERKARGLPGLQQVRGSG